MSYLKFDKDLMVNLSYSLYRNILRTNRKGAYHNASISGCNTSKYQGLLVMPVNGENHVMLSSMDETIIQHGAEFNLSIHKYEGDNYTPKGHKYIREFNCDTAPKTIYRVGGVIFSKKVMFSSEENKLMIRYTLIDAHSPTVLRLRPLMAFRKASELTTENDQADKSYLEVENGISMCLYDGYPRIFMQLTKKGEFYYYPTWYKNVEYIQDQQNGDTYIEDLYSPGYFEVPIQKGEEIVVAVGDYQMQPSSFLKDFEIELAKRTPRTSFYNCLKNSSHQFFYHPNPNELFLIAGYPWYKVRARDLFISLPGVTLSVDRNEDFETIMDSSIPYLEKLMSDDLSHSPIAQIYDPDVLLWTVWSLQVFKKKYPIKFNSKYSDFVLKIIEYIKSNLHPNLRYENDTKLLNTFGHDVAVSWMNVTMYGKPIIKRSGYLVEFNALWYNALCFGLEVWVERNNLSIIKSFEDVILQLKESFTKTFLNNAGYLYDYVDEGYKNKDVRPNMLFAVSLPYSPLEKSQKKTVLDFVTRELLTNCGIRSLSPKSGNFRAHHTGTIEEKDFAYFNGISFPWLFGPYIEACLNVFNRSGLSIADRIMVEMEGEMQNDCIGSISEMYDSSPPFISRGAYSFAMSVGELLRAKSLIKEFENKLT